MPRLFYPPLVEPGVYIKPKGIQEISPEQVALGINHLRIIVFRNIPIAVKEFKLFYQCSRTYKPISHSGKLFHAAHTVHQSHS